MTIYVDSLFLLNAMLNYLLFLGSAWLGGTPARRWRFLGAAVVGGLYAVGCAIPGFEILCGLPCKILSLVLMLLIAEGPGRGTVKFGLIFLALSLAFGGLVLAMLQIFGTGLMLVNGAAYYPLSAGALVLTAAAVYLLARTVLSRVARHTGGELVELEVRFGSRSARLTALRDSGNTLTDPASNRGVLVAEWPVAKALLPPPAAEGLEGAGFARPADLLPRMAQAAPSGKWRLIPYRAVGTGGAMLLAMRCDAVRIGKRSIQGALVAFSPTPLSDGGGYTALIGGTL